MVGAALPATKMARFLMRIRRDGWIGCPMNNPNPSNGSGSSLLFSWSYFFSPFPFMNEFKKHISIWFSLLASKAADWRASSGTRFPRLMQTLAISMERPILRFQSQNASATGLSFLWRMGLLKLTITAQKQKQLWYGSSQVINFLLPKRIIVSNLSNITAPPPEL